VIIWGDDPYLPKLNYTKRVLKFGIKENNDIIAKNIINNDHGLSFDVIIHGDLFGHFALPFYGMHMLYDSLAVITLGYLENMESDYIQKRLSAFEGVKRRYTVKEVGNNIYVDDYAHHPTAIRYVIEATRSRYPGREIVAIFQPDRFSRGLRFAKEFAQAMELADYPFLVHFPENAKKEPGIDIDIYEIAQYIPRAKVIHEDEEAVKLLADHDHVVYVFMSSKDIYKLEDMVIAYKESH
ncbi:MAG: UDP-N-acetylmuramate--alanine ligase, partial [Erysipelotrichaceae bacterium]|nr:UDP-N-acetylmuramate--alanine ligase [Erysipelotrichaceae bacterium]